MKQFICIQQDIDEITCKVLSINTTHIKATESLLKYIGENNYTFEKIIINPDRIEIYEHYLGFFSDQKSLKYVFIIQEFETEKVKKITKKIVPAKKVKTFKETGQTA